MRNIIIIGLVIFISQSCGEGSGNAMKQTDTIFRPDSVKAMPKVETVQKRDDTIKNKIIGTWGTITDENQNASFDIQENKIYYPDLFKFYKYRIVKDTIKIQYDDYEGLYLIKMKGKDTLILIGDEEQAYYRIKK